MKGETALMNGPLEAQYVKVERSFSYCLNWLDILYMCFSPLKKELSG